STALDCLRTLGSSLAVVQLANLSRQLRTRLLREKARTLLEQTAQRRGLSVEALEDRAVPTLGFQGGAGPVFDFGPRRFRAVLAGAVGRVRRARPARAGLPRQRGPAVRRRRRVARGADRPDQRPRRPSHRAGRAGAGALAGGVERSRAAAALRPARPAALLP